MDKIKIVSMSILLFIGVLGAQDLTITTPNGGEQLIVGNKHPIHWDWSGSITSVRLEYSTDGGINWVLIASTTQNDGDYLWTIPNTISTDCFVKISDVSAPAIFDLSDGSFSIIRPAIDIKKPDGGEILRIGEYYPIHWDWTGQFSNVRIDYSTDGGSSWSVVVANSQNDGGHYWPIPNAPSSNCRIKVTNINDPTCFNVSDNDFTIAINTISVIKPNGGEAYTTGEIYPIYWDWTGSFVNVRIDYSTDGGATWNSIVSSTANDGSHKWTIPNTSSNSCRIKITNTNDPGCFDVSDNDFTILSTGLQLVCPDGGETYVVGDLCPIHWDWIGTISSVKLEYSTDGGTVWNTIISSTPNDGDYIWTVPAVSSDQYRIKITNIDDPNCWDMSGANFTVQSPSFSVIDPDSGKELVVGESYPIHWDWRGTVSSVRLELWYKTQSGIEWWTIIPGTTNDGGHYFAVPNYISDSCGIQITSNDDVSCYAWSEIFKIVHPTIEVIYPNGGENFIEGEEREIFWNWNGNFTSVMIQYSIDGGSNWTTITTSTTNDGSYAWTVSNTPSTNCLIKVIDTQDIDASDVSDASFTIARPSIEVIRPKQSDVFYMKHKQPIYWRWDGDFSNVKIDYSIDGGSNWNNIILSTQNTGYYLWTADTFTSANAMIRIIDNQDPVVIGTSDTFTIADTSSLTEPIRLLAPVANDSFVVGGKYYITWHSQTFPTNYINLYYSTDGGASFQLIVSNFSNSPKNYQWTVPNAVSDNCLIRIEDVNQSVADTSELFLIVPQEMTIVSPTAVKEWIVGRKYYILWDWTGGFANVIIDYSYNGGSDWVNITTSTTNDGKYEWTVPNAPSTNCLVRIKNYENENIYAVSDTFTIKPQTIDVSYPVASDSFVVGRKYYITWDYTGVFSNVNIEYSIDGGSNWTTVATSVSNNQRYEWTVPNIPSDLVMVRVINSANLNVVGLSDTFSIIPQVITVTSPVLDDQWIIGRHYYITWFYTGNFSNVKIEYSYDNGGSWNTVVDNTSNSRNYRWTVPNTPSDNCLVRISNSDNLNVSDASELFRIPLQTIDITSPETGDELVSGRKYYITWRWTGTFTNVHIEYSADNGSNWSYIQTNATNNGSYEWTIPTASSESCFVRLTNPQNSSVYDISEMFSMLPQEISITSPVFSDTLIAGRKYYLTWRTKGSFSNADIWYSLDGGQNWTVITTNVSNSGYYEWFLPEAPSDLARIKIANSAQPLVFALSDTFIISPPILEFTSPALGNLWYCERKYYITWNCLGGIQQVNLFYSTNGGSSWEQIVANQQNQGYYEWTVPSNISSQNCYVELVSSANATISYMSDSFEIAVIGIEEGYPIKQLPKEFALQGFTPNPFVNRGEIKLAIPKSSEIRLTLYDICGRLVSRIFEGNIEPGFHSHMFGGKNDIGQNLPRGVYFLRLEARNKKENIYDRTIKILKI